MTEVFLGIGSNTDRQYHIALALDWLGDKFPQPRFSSVYESAAIGFEGRPFYNLVAAISTELSVGALAAQLKELEFAYGRKPNAPRFSPRNIDLDILTYGELTGEVDGVLLPRGEILYNAFVLRPLAEIAPDRLHPALKVSYRELWSDFDHASQQLVPIDFPGTPTR